MKSKYSNGNIFNDVKIQKFPRHKFNKSYFNKFTCNHGLAVPFFVDDVVPGDKIDINTFGRIQLQPLATSSMQNMRAYFRYFYVPYRLLWPDWDKFMTQDPNDETRLRVPATRLFGSYINRYFNNGDLPDMLGVNVKNYDTNGQELTYSDDTILSFNLFRFGAYHLIWDYYFRDQNLQEPVFPEEGLTNMSPNNFVGRYSSLLPVAYEKDYFTTALPWPQKGDPVNLSALVYSDGSVRFDDGLYNYTMGSRNNLNIPDPDGSVHYYGSPVLIPDETITQIDASVREVELSTGTLTTSFNINDLRYSNALQRFLERKALGGSRPAEFYLSMYGVHVDDLRIGQPLYLGGGYSSISITDVASTVESNEVPQGSLAGNGKTFPAMKINSPYFCQEFGVVMGIMYIRPEINYSQGLDKRLQLFDTLDFFNPVFAHLGEEPILKSELVLTSGLINDSTHPNYNDEIFGYQSRYAYLKHKRNEIHGEFKSSLSHWVLSTHFPPEVALNSEFITVDQNYDIFAINDPVQHHYLVELFNDYQTESNMPDFSIPSL